jgi:hypothetical protein
MFDRLLNILIEAKRRGLHADGGGRGYAGSIESQRDTNYNPELLRKLPGTRLGGVGADTPKEGKPAKTPYIDSLMMGSPLYKKLKARQAARNQKKT